jgi:hypothetical protein
MIRTLRLALAASAALVAFAVNSASAQAIFEFHCSASPCTYTAKADGTGKAAHHVFVVKNELGETLSFTCNQLTGEATSAATTGWEITLTKIGYDGCSAFGTPVVTRMNGCDYRFDVVLAGEFVVGRLQIKCPEGKSMEFEMAQTGCVLTIGSQGTESGVTYKTIGTSPNREITLEINLKALTGALDGTSAQCLFNKVGVLKFEYTTGNTILTGETSGGVMADAWFV